jgi:hypothetical protein
MVWFLIHGLVVCKDFMQFLTPSNGLFFLVTHMLNWKWQNPDFEEATEIFIMNFLTLPQQAKPLFIHVHSAIARVAYG